MRAPTRVLVVEDVGSWVSILSRAARRAGASEVVACENLEAVRQALRAARFDVAILDIGLDPADDLNADGIKVLKAIRELDGLSTRCVMVTGWQGGDRMDLQAFANQQFGVDWAYMKEKYDSHAVISKLTELLELSANRRLSQTAPMQNLAPMKVFHLEDQLLDSLTPAGGVQTLYSLVSRLLISAIPTISMHPFTPMEKGPDGVYAGLYWSRALATAVAVGLTPAAQWQQDDPSAIPAGLARLLPEGVVPDLIESVRERNLVGLLWELPGIDREEFAD